MPNERLPHDPLPDLTAQLQRDESPRCECGEALERGFDLREWWRCGACGREYSGDAERTALQPSEEHCHDKHPSDLDLRGRERCRRALKDIAVILDTLPSPARKFLAPIDSRVQYLADLLGAEIKGVRA